MQTSKMGRKMKKHGAPLPLFTQVFNKKRLFEATAPLPQAHGAQRFAAPPQGSGEVRKTTACVWQTPARRLEAANGGWRVFGGGWRVTDHC